MAANNKEAPMLGWSITFLIVAVVAAFFGFGGVATAFADLAKITFVVAAVLFLLSLVFGALPRERFVGGARWMGVLALGGLIGLGVYAWMDNDMSAERLGRSIDRSVVEVADATDDAADRAAGFVSETVDETRDEAAEAINEDEAKSDPN
jgi:uncharacterized membrane protein YtjA (UPF0391 family)